MAPTASVLVETLHSTKPGPPPFVLPSNKYAYLTPSVPLSLNSYLSCNYELCIVSHSLSEQVMLRQGLEKLSYIWKITTSLQTICT